MLDNRTLYLHFFLQTPNPLLQALIDDPTEDQKEAFSIVRNKPYMNFFKSMPLIKYQKKQKPPKTVNLFEADVPDPSTAISKDNDTDEDQTFYPHFKHEIYLNLIYDA